MKYDTDWYEKFLQSYEGKEMLAIFDEEVGQVKITELKIVDLALWQTRSKG